MPTLRLLSHVRRLGWGVADQAMSSVTNFVLVIYVAHAVTAAQFGAFSLAYVTYQFAANASRGLASDPLLVRFSGVDLQTWRRAVGSCTGTAAVTGVATGICVLVVAAGLGGAAKFAFLALGLTLPVLLLQDSWRFSFFALGRGVQAFLNDLVWAVALIPALVLLRAARAQNVFWFIFAWGAAAGVAAAAGLLQAQVAPRLFEVRRWLSQQRDLGYRYLAANTANSGAGQLLMFSVSLIIGLAAVGYIQAATTLMSPAMVLQAGMIMVGIPEGARMLRRSPQRLLQFCVLVSGGLAAAALAWGAVLLIALPRGLGTLMVGSIWRPAYPLVLPTVLWIVGICARGGAEIGLRALGAARRSLRATIFASAAILACGMIGAVSGGAVGTVRGLAIAAWFNAVLWWWQLHQAKRKSGTAPIRGRYAAQHYKPAATPLRCATASGLAGSDSGPSLDTTTAHLPGARRNAPPASRPDWVAQLQPSSPRAEAQLASSPQAKSAGIALSESQLLPSLPSASLFPPGPPVASAPLPSGPANLPAPPNWSTPPSVPAIPMPSFSWTVVVASDRTYYDRMWMARALSNSSVAFPVFGSERRIALAGIQMRIGRRSATHDLEPEIDLAEPSADPGVSRLHAVLIAGPDGSWAVLDPGSVNGTLLNGRKIAIGDVVPLHDGDRINLGAWTVITVHCQ